MSTSTAKPSITATEFDRIEPQLRAELQRWWEEESQPFDVAVTPTSDVWQGLPAIDSKAVVKASPIIRRFTGGDLDPRLIRRGGYRSFDDMANELLAKIRASCLSIESAAQRAEPVRESVNVARS